VDEDLREQVRELNERIAELEAQIALLLAPVQEMQKTSTKYLRLVETALRHGGISPDMLVPEVTDPISRDIICVLVDRGHLNISQITEGVRQRRGTASRRIVREKVGVLEDDGIVRKNVEKKTATYYLSHSVLKKWSHMLGITL
jgi:DNA-binding transcriptional ArsR family regulator